VPSQRFKLEWADLEPWGGPDDSIVNDPSADDIDAILDVLAEAEEGFVILSAEDELYIQAAAPTEVGGSKIVEHRAGSADAHFSIDEPIFDAARLKTLFRAFHANPAVISAAAPWRKIDM
jgi:hypothetical protein